MMNERVQSITLKTVLPLALVLGLLSVTWALASDRQQTIQRLITIERVVEKAEGERKMIREQLDALAKSMIRVEVALGTLPESRKPRSVIE